MSIKSKKINRILHRFLNERKSKMKAEDLKPSVFAVGEDYQIMIPLAKNALVWVKVGDDEYFDDSNGILRSSTPVHRVTVPQTELDKEKKYTVFCRGMVERKPYFPVTEAVVEREFAFKPLEKTDNINIYQIADAHGRVETSAKAAAYFGDDLDVLIFNGDVADHSGTPQNICKIYETAYLATNGGIPCVFSRGNHDLRGEYAEKLAELTPNDCGRSYYTFRIGCIFGVLLDCGEDKTDDHAEYGHTICCHNFRQRETRFLKSFTGFDEKDVKYRLVINHVPISYKMPDPFDIEHEIYGDWLKTLKERYKPNLMLCGHLHRLYLSECGSEFDIYGQPCTVVVGSDPETLDKTDKDGFTGMAVTLKGDYAEIVFNDNTGAKSGKQTVKIK